MFNVNTANASKTDLSVGGVGIKMIIDSGIWCNIIDRNLRKLMKSEPVKCNCYFTDKKFYAYGNDETLEVTGAFEATIEIPGKSLNDVEFVVIEESGKALLGNKTATDLGILQIMSDINLVSRAESLMSS